MSSQFNILHNRFPHSTTPTVVAMSVYHGDNVEWVREAITSIVTQIYRQFVFIIVIDGEIPVKMMNLIKDAAFDDARIVIGQNDSNLGLASSMNHAIEWAMALNPRYFVRMDADDISVPNRLERQISYMEKHQNIAVLGSALQEINEQGVHVGARVMPANHRQITYLLPRRCTLNHPTVVIRFDVFRAGYLYQGELKNTQDYFLWVTLAANGFVFRNLKDRLLKFRRVNDFYKRRGLSKSLNEYRARLYAMKKLRRLTAWNLFYATAVLGLRLMPAKVVKMAYRLDRHLLDRIIKH